MRALSRALSSALWLVLGCDAPAQLAPEQLVPKSEPAPVLAPVPSALATRPSGAPDPRLPIVGDPLGLLSRPTPSKEASSLAKSTTKTSFDPGALTASTKLAPATIVPERDSRAVARGAQAMAGEPRRFAPVSTQAQGPVVIEEKSASEVIGSIRRSAARPHVLFLYASYCPACRNVLPDFLPLVQYYRARGVQFTAASVDGDASAYEGYAPALKGVLPPVLIRSEGETRNELVRAGLSFSGTGYSIPLVAVFDKGHRLVRQGGGGELARLPQTLDSLPP